LLLGHSVDSVIRLVRYAVRHRELRALVDLVAIHETMLPLGAAIWAAAVGTHGFTPEGMIATIRRNSFYPRSEWRELAALHSFDPAAVHRRLRHALDEAELFVNRMPSDLIGILFLEDGKIVQPDPDQLARYQHEMVSAKWSG
jgi:hypothetical protein